MIAEAQVSKFLTHIKKLDEEHLIHITDRELTDDDIQKLINEIRRAEKRVHKMILTDNKITTKGLKLILALRSVTSLLIGGNNLSDDSLIMLLKAQFEQLDISGNQNLSSAGILNFVKNANVTTLSIYDFGNLELNPEDLLTAFRANTNITTLECDTENFTDDQMNELQDIINSRTQQSSSHSISFS